MYLRTEYKTNSYIRKSKFGKLAEYQRTKKIYIFSCDNCKSEIIRDTNYHSHRLTLEYTHFCKLCRGHVNIRGLTNRKNKLDKKIGEKWIDSCGYIVIRMSGSANYSGKCSGRNYRYVREHLKVMQDHIGRRLKENEVVHHIDGDKTNNDLSNLDLCTKQEHNKCHAVSEELVFILYKRGIIGYNRETKRYYLVQ